MFTLTDKLTRTELAEYFTNIRESKLNNRISVDKYFELLTAVMPEINELLLLQQNWNSANDECRALILAQYSWCTLKEQELNEELRTLNLVLFQEEDNLHPTVLGAIEDRKHEILDDIVSLVVLPRNRK